MNTPTPTAMAASSQRRPGHHEAVSCTMAAVNETSRTVVAEHVERADTFMTRLVGLMGRKGLADDQGMWIATCKSIHTMWMRFPIDVVFLDKELRVVAVRERVAPWRATPFIKTASSVLELSAGAVERTGLMAGDQLGFLSATDESMARCKSDGREEHP